MHIGRGTTLSDQDIAQWLMENHDKLSGKSIFEDLWCEILEYLKKVKNMLEKEGK